MELYDYLLLPSEQKIKAIEETLEQVGKNLKWLENHLKWFEDQRKRDIERYNILQSKFYELEKENEKLKIKLTTLQNKQRKGGK